MSEVIFMPASEDDDRLRHLAGSFLATYPNENTRTGYAREIRRWFTWCQVRGVDPLTAHRTEVEVFMRELEPEYAVNTVCRITGCLASWFKWLVHEEHIVTTPMLTIKRPSKDTSPKQIRLSRHDLMDMLTAAENRCHPGVWGLVSLLALNALRVSEAVTPNIEDLAESHWHHTLAIWGKGDKPDVIPLHARTMLAISAATKGRTTGPLLLNEWGNRMSRANARHAVRKVADLAGLQNKRVTPHTFRHAAITAALNAGVPMRDVQSFARHADPKTTMHYDRNRDSFERHATYNVAQYIAGSE